VAASRRLVLALCGLGRKDGRYVELAAVGEDRSMSEFTYLFRGRLTSGSPNDMQRHFQMWVAWFNDLDAKGHLKERGYPLEKAGQVVMGKQRIVHDGPFAEAKDVVGGYIVVEAGNLAQAVELSKGCPILDVGGSVEVRPVEA
jgi:hypothetical protein